MFKYSVSKGNIRRVKTPEGSRFFGLPIGSIITPGSIYAAKRRHGDDHRLQAALDHEDRAPDPGTGLAVQGTRGSLTRHYVSAPDMRGADGMEERARHQKELRDLRRRALQDDHADMDPKEVERKFKELSAAADQKGDDPRAWEAQAIETWNSLTPEQKAAFLRLREVGRRGDLTEQLARARENYRKLQERRDELRRKRKPKDD